MATLSPEQLSFLTYHRIASSLLFDATGMRTADYKAAMKVGGQCFAFGVTPCAAARHTLRTRAGHCVQCDPAKISYILRYVSPGVVYVAGSRAGGLLKVGSAEVASGRQDSLRNTRYAGHGDWTILAHAKCKEAGKQEGAVQARLADWRASGSYLKGASWQECYELFRCDFDRALDALQAVVGQDVAISISTQELSNYRIER